MTSSPAPGRCLKICVSVALLYVGALFLVDTWLFQKQGFLALRGPGTQEGQILHKMELSRHVAPDADIIFLGSSQTRSCLDNEAFLKEGLIPLNMGITGGGPITSYYILDSLVPYLQERKKRKLPVILAIDLFRPLLIDSDDVKAKKQFGEFLQFSYVVRDRARRLDDFAELFDVFLSQGAGTSFLADLVLPSGVYREHVGRVIGQWRFPGGYQGKEDYLGFAALHSRTGFPAIARQEAFVVSNKKVAYLRRLLAAAFQLTDKVILHAAAGEYEFMERDALLPLVDSLRAEFPGLRFLPFDRDRFTMSDFQGNHLNLHGSRKNSLRFVEFLKKEGMMPSREERLSGGFERLFPARALPPLDTWRAIIPPGLAAPRLSSHRIEGAGQSEESANVQFISPDIEVIPGRPIYLAFTSQELAGSQISAAMLDSGPELNVASAPLLSEQATEVMALTPRTNRIQVSIGIQVQTGDYRYAFAIERLVQPAWDEATEEEKR